MTPQLIIAALIAAAGFGSGWTINSWRHASMEADRVQQQLIDQRTSAATAIRRQDNVITATNEATVRAAALRNDATAARSALDGLRTSTDAALRAAAASHEACTERANTYSELLGTMAATGGDIAAQADLHANDAKTLSDGWPK